MATTLSSVDFNLALVAILSKTGGQVTPETIRGGPTLNQLMSFTSGTGDDQADKLYVASGTLAASGNVQIDLAGTVLDYFGAAITFAKVKILVIKNMSNVLSTPTDAVFSIGGGTDGSGAAAFSTIFDAADNKLLLNAGGVFCLAVPDTGYVVTAGSADILRIQNLDAEDQGQYEVVIIGASA